MDVKEPEFEPTAAHELLPLDLREFPNCAAAVEGVEEVYHVAAARAGTRH